MNDLDTNNDLVPCTEEQFHTALKRSGYIISTGQWVGASAEIKLGGIRTIIWMVPGTSQKVAMAKPKRPGERDLWANPVFMEEPTDWKEGFSWTG